MIPLIRRFFSSFVLFNRFSNVQPSNGICWWFLLLLRLLFSVASATCYPKIFLSFLFCVMFLVPFRTSSTSRIVMKFIFLFILFRLKYLFVVLCAWVDSTICVIMKVYRIVSLSLCMCVNVFVSLRSSRSFLLFHQYTGEANESVSVYVRDKIQ